MSQLNQGPGDPWDQGYSITLGSIGLACIIVSVILGVFASYSLAGHGTGCWGMDSEAPLPR